MADGIVGIPLKRNGWPRPGHPHVERVMQEQVGKDRTDHAALRRPGIARLDHAIFPLHRRLQPALHIEQHPRAAGMSANRTQEQRVIDAVEEHLGVTP